MKAAIVTIGNELLAGYTVDSNSTWMGRKLMDAGIETVFKLSVRDVRDEILDAFRVAAGKADVILTTGGLGPTSDDVTKEAFCKLTGARLRFHEDYYEKLQKAFERRDLEMPEANREQAYVPDTGEVIPNPKGSALGIHYEAEGKKYYVLPGVPSEMKAMMEESVLPAVSELVSTGLRVTTLRTTGLMESALHEMVSDLVEASPAAVSFIPGFLGVDVRLTSRDENAVLELSSAILDRLGNHVYAEDWETLEEAVGRLLREEGLTLAVAESCTGGLLADRLTDVPGSSDYFLGGVVTYSDGAKVSMLGVKEDTLASTGAVSEETAREMARGVRELLQAHLGVAITGIAGPTGGTPGKPVGLTYIGLDYAGDCHVIRYIFSEDRRFNKELAAQAALNSIRLALI